MKNRLYKKILCVLLSIAVIFCSGTAFSMSIEAANYTQQLKAKGFPDSYVGYLVKLHDKYPNWDFEPFKTNLNWSDAVAGERKPHSKQLIQKQSSLSNAYYCICSSCYKNGKFVVQEGSSWYSASEKAVKYYMDPRNWLTEKYIFQFESTDYDSSQTQSGVESIISPTWMHNSNITYVDGNGKSHMLNKKYSAAILEAAKSSGMSAYYLASKIVQEVGSNTNTYASGSNGKKSPFLGIYNYYNIGAYSGGMEGLEWASGYLKANEKTTLYSSYDSSKGTVGGTKTTVSQGQYMSYIGTYGKYYKVKLYTGSGNSFSTNGKVGYIINSNDVLRKKYFNYERPWTNPYKSIIGGAPYIAKGFSKYQNTGYLQKFNVNKNSGNLYNHEYMANVQAASAESVTTYKAYQNAGILKSSKVFYIPVYNKMPSSPCTMSSTNSTTTTTTTATQSTTVKNLKLTGTAETSLSVKWDAVSKASKYYIAITNNTKGTSFSKTVTTNSATLNNLTLGNQYSVKVCAYVSGKWGAYSNKITAKTAKPKPPATSSSALKAPSGLKTTVVYTATAKLAWNKVSGASGYYVYKYSGGKYTKAYTIKGGSTTNCTVKGLSPGTKYYYCVAAYNSSKTGSRSSNLSFVTKPNGTKITSSSSPSKTKIKINWQKPSRAYNGYQIVYSRKSNFSKLVATKNISDKNTTTYTGKNFTKGVTYYIRVRSYRTVDGKKYYSVWSNTVKVKSK